MKKVFIVHGFEGQPNGGWRPWLERELADLNVYACSLPMPTPASPDCKEWLAMMDYCLGVPDKEVCLVGHSLGVPAILRYLEKTKNKVGGAVLVSGPIRTKKGYQGGKLDSFFKSDFDFKKIRNKAGRFAVIHGDDDKNVDLNQGRELAEELGAELIVVKGGGHLNGASGCRELPQCLLAIKKLMNLRKFSGKIY